MSAQLDVFLPLPLTTKGPSYTCGMLARGMAAPDFQIAITTPRARGHRVSPAEVVQVLPRWARYMPYKWVRSLAGEKIEGRFLSQVTTAQSEGGVVYIWPDASLDAIHALKRKNIKIFREMINCHRRSAKIILDDAYQRLGLAPVHSITDASVRAEQAALEAVDYVFCSNTMVEASLLESGLPASKLVSASYGWDPQRFSGSGELLAPCEGVTAVFVGSICVRKGCHLLLDYWARSNVKGRLVLAGVLEPAIRERCADLLARPNVVVLDYVNDVGALYRAADFFVFPSLEEGGPQVTYEACGCGLPVITTPMGMGRIVRHDQEGFVLDPYDREGWVDAIRSLAEDGGRRKRMGAAAAQRAGSFHWDEVAIRRRQQILDRVAPARPCTTSSGGFVGGGT
ncbi:glycosyltransferase family 4 protein [Bradyrhizobium sp. CCGB12]|uniref:glycosyltransferase family 4 protein n=1 Tax=Bradyrhizobium sp. CCGB12 TaxID=2949632 RepID=UPI0020B3528E|nr:glycosyltransferase family 4 protein [Bradyrhizobium sp. CCGB12]MCP3390677.1 glycosyltransferase family 4 protein [Bradyrhizobium sp. CCGB12]